MKNELPRVELEPMTLYTLDRALYRVHECTVTTLSSIPTLNTALCVWQLHICCYWFLSGCFSIAGLVCSVCTAINSTALRVMWEVRRRLLHVCWFINPCPMTLSHTFCWLHLVDWMLLMAKYLFSLSVSLRPLPSPPSSLSSLCLSLSVSPYLPCLRADFPDQKPRAADGDNLCTEAASRCYSANKHDNRLLSDR